MSEKRGEHESLTRGVRSWVRLLRDPAGWSQDWYRLKNTYDNVAVRSDLDRERADEPPPGPVSRLRDRVGRRLASKLASSGWGDEKADKPNPTVE